jgi:hypothetical protein
LPGGDRGLVVDEVFDAVGADGRAPLPQHDVAGGDDVAVLLALDALGLHELRAFALGPARGEPEMLLQLELSPSSCAYPAEGTSDHASASVSVQNRLELNGSALRLAQGGEARC